LNSCAREHSKKLVAMPMRPISPHPEHGAGTAQGYGHRDAGDVATADAPRHADDQRLEGADMALFVVQGSAEHREHAPEIAELHGVKPR
jgi:hypothetical protein